MNMYIDGKIIEVSAKTQDAFTPGVFKAKGVFETIRVDRQGMHFFTDHLARMKQGLKILHIPYRFKEKAWQAIASQITDGPSPQGIYRLRLMVWREGRCVHEAAMISPYQGPTQAQRARGFKVCLIPTTRPGNRRLAAVKSLDYTLFSSALTQARSQGFDDAILLNNQGHVFESTRANIFAVIDGKMMTPPLSSGCLSGVMRARLLSIGKAIGKPIQEKNMSPAMLKKASTAVLTNSLWGIVPINLDSLLAVR